MNPRLHRLHGPWVEVDAEQRYQPDGAAHVELDVIDGDQDALTGAGLAQLAFEPAVQPHERLRRLHRGDGQECLGPACLATHVLQAALFVVEIAHRGRPGDVGLAGIEPGPGGPVQAASGGVCWIL